LRNLIPATIPVKAPDPIITGKAARGALGRDEQRVFDLVVQRFLGAFYPDAEFANTELVVRVGPPSGRNVTAWTTLLTDSEQAEVWRSVDRAPQPCAVANPALARNWLGPRTLESLPPDATHWSSRGMSPDSTVRTRPRWTRRRRTP